MLFGATAELEYEIRGTAGIGYEGTNGICNLTTFEHELTGTLDANLSMPAPSIFGGKNAKFIIGYRISSEFSGNGEASCPENGAYTTWQLWK